MKIRALPKGVSQYRDRHGKLRTRGRRKGCKDYAFQSEPGTEEFQKELLRWQTDTAQPKIGAARTKSGSINDLIVRYYKSAEFFGLADTTKTTYRGIIERFRNQHGNKPVRELQHHHVRAIIAAKRETPAAANNLLKILRVLMCFAINEGFRSDDPTLGVKNVKNRTTGFHTWTEDEIHQFCAVHETGSRARLAFDLLLYTGQRRSDVICIGRQHLHNGKLHIRQRKTGTELDIPMHPALKASILATATGQLTFLVTGKGLPYTAAGFGNWFKECTRAAKLPECCAAHGLRKAAARRLAEAGCSPSQIAAITGHRTLKEVARYTAAASQSHLAEDAMAAQMRSEQERNSPGAGQNLANLSEKFAKKSK